MKKICIIVLYFGKLPDYFPIWLKSCEFNKNIDFLVITNDKTSYIYPKNVKVIYKTFKEIKINFQKFFDFEISLESPYKLCDYKPAYGEAFSEYLKGYEFWGHCDIDLFFGNIRKFITDDILDNYDRILTRGHFSLYRNTKEINMKYRNCIVEGCQNYKDVYSKNDSCCYDEWGGHCGNGISEIFKRIGMKQYDELLFADLSFLKYKFKLAQESNDKSKNRFFIFDKGEVYGYAINNGNVVKTEYMYCHFQKRNPKINLNDKIENFCFLPPNIFEQNNIKNYDIKTLKRITRIKNIYMTPISFRIKQIKSKLKNIKM